MPFSSRSVQRQLNQQKEIDYALQERKKRKKIKNGNINKKPASLRVQSLESDNLEELVAHWNYCYNERCQNNEETQDPGT